jgi:uncharacterized protein (TIGR03435 family)
MHDPFWSTSVRCSYLAAVALLFSTLGINAQSCAGSWQGKLQTASSFRIVFRIENANDGSLHGALYQPDQSADGVVLSAVTCANNELNLTQAVMNLTYRGKLSRDGQRIDGTLIREGKTYILQLAPATPESVWKHETSAAVTPMASSPDMAFEVATIKPSRPDTPRSIRTRTRILSTTGTTLENLIGFAWQLRAPCIDGEPGWVKTEKFDLNAEPNMEGQPTEEQDRVMLHKLLAERFGLKFHMTNKEFPVLALGLEQNHIHMGPSNPEFWRGSIYVKETDSGDSQVQFVGQTMFMFADTLMNFIRERQIVDETGLDGHFDFTLNVNTADLKSNSEEIRGDAVRSAAKEAGFTFTSKRVSLPVLMIDAVEKPSEN